MNNSISNRYTKQKFISTIKGCGKEIAYWTYFIMSIMIKCIYFQLNTFITQGPIFSATNSIMLTTTLLVLLVFVGITLLVFNKRRLLALFVVDIILSFVLIADNIYYRYYYNAITVTLIYQISFLGSVGESIKSLFKVADIIYLIDLPFMFIGYKLLKRSGISVIGTHKRLITAALILVIGVAGTFVSYTFTNKFGFYCDNTYVIRSTGIFYFHYYDTRKFIEESVITRKPLTSEDKAAIDGFYKGRTKESENYKGAAKGKNVIVVQVEALQDFVLNKKVNGVEITPNLNKLAKESLYFKNYYYQIGEGNTSDAEFLSNSSLYPIKQGSVNFRYPTNDYYTLPKFFKEQGYSTYAFHAYIPSFWNRLTVYRNFGFDKFASKNDYAMDEVKGWSLSDKSFFRQSLDKIDTSKPFYGFFVTLSSHHPYSYVKDWQFNSGKFEGTMLGNYLKSISYADYCIGQFIEDLKARGLYDNTVLALYGDHRAFYRDQADDMLKFLNTEYDPVEWQKLQKVPCIIHYPDLKGGKVVETVGGQVDFQPTLANLMGIDTPYAMGKDLLNTANGYAVMRDGSVVTDKYVYVSETGKVYDSKTGKTVSDDIFDNEIKPIQDELNISELIISKNAFKKEENN